MDQMIEYAAYSCNDTTPDLIDQMVLSHAKSVDQQVLAGVTALEWIPFDPTSKKSSSKVRLTSGSSGPAEIWVSKGAPQAIAALCDDGSISGMSTIVEQCAAEGLRCIAVAVAVKPEQWELCGLLSFCDPPRDDAATTIQVLRSHWHDHGTQEIQSLGVNVKMVTGDHKAIACSVAGQIGLSTDIVDEALFRSRNSDQPLSPHDLDHICCAGGFAQV